MEIINLLFLFICNMQILQNIVSRAQGASPVRSLSTKEVRTCYSNCVHFIFLCQAGFTCNIFGPIISAILLTSFMPLQLSQIGKSHREKDYES